MAEADYLGRIKKLLPTAEDELLADALGSGLQDAVARYSVLRSQLAAYDFTGDGSTYDFALPAGWITGFSKVISIEYPAGDQIPAYLDSNFYGFYLDPTQGLVLRFYVTPSAGGTARVLFTKPQVVKGTVDTIPAEDFEAVCFLAAHSICLSLAGKYSGFYEPSFEADVIRYRTKAADYQSLARQFKALFQQHLSMKVDDIAPASMSWIDLDLPRVGLEIEPVLRSR